MPEWVRRRVTAPILQLLRQGITPEKIALSIALGVTLGIAPMLGTTSLLCFLAALALRLNQPAIQLVNYLVYPLQLALLVPFLKLGERVFGAQASGLSLSQITGMVRAHPWNAINTLWIATVHALVVWLILSAVMAGILYSVLAVVLRQAGARMRPAAGDA